MDTKSNLLTCMILRKIIYSKPFLVEPLSENYFNTIINQDKTKNNLIYAHFYGQLAHESDNFKTLEEYSSGKAYEGRKDLGNTTAGDGVKYKGRGYIQITGKDAYEELSKIFSVEFVNNPELLSVPMWGLKASKWFWDKNNLSELALKDDVKSITKIINGGHNGLEDRQEKVNIFKEIFNH